jgi:hypothetical protein
MGALFRLSFCRPIESVGSGVWNGICISRADGWGREGLFLGSALAFACLLPGSSRLFARCPPFIGLSIIGIVISKFTTRDARRFSIALYRYISPTFPIIILVDEGRLSGAS